MAQIMKTTSGKSKGQLRSLFVVLSDDNRESIRRGPDHAEPERAQDRSGSRHQDDRSGSGSSSSGESESGSENEAGPVNNSRSSTRVEDPTRRVCGAGSSNEIPPESRTESRSVGRGSKRGPPSSQGGKSKSRR